MFVFDHQRLVLGICVFVVVLGGLMMAFARGDVFTFWDWDCQQRHAFQGSPQAQAARDRLCPSAGLSTQALIDQLQCVSDRAPRCARTGPDPAAVGTGFLVLGLAGAVYGVSRTRR
jgi:hypothetical protein